MIVKHTITAMMISGLLLVSAASSAGTEEYNSGFIAAESGDYDSAVLQWGPLAERGNALAQFNLAMLYHSGSGVPQNETEALKWYTAAAENGYYKAQEYLAVGYAEGWFGLSKDQRKAIHWQNRIDSGK
ncbi:MAG: tetratricopeptide repeat protein [Thiohalomonadales bacterium]